MIACRILIIRDPKAWIERISGRERGMARALMFADVWTLNRNVFGDNQRSVLEDWLGNEDPVYPLERKQLWYEGRANESSLPLGTSDAEGSKSVNDILDRERMRHTDRRVHSVIDMVLWDRAGWKGMVFVCQFSRPPILGIAFENGEDGEAIFRGWRERWGKEDREDQLRLSIVTELSMERPLEYAVVVGPSLHYNDEDQGKVIISVSRFHRMTPDTSENLSRFVEAYERANRFVLAPAKVGSRGDDLLKLLSMGCAIGKRRLNILKASEIGENDPEMVVLREDVDRSVHGGSSCADRPWKPPCASVIRM